MSLLEHAVITRVVIAKMALVASLLEHPASRIVAAKLALRYHS
jgi:hypothetical protein